ncbi:hypothetical protein STEG23_004784, partial [Scotinomys teguina]
RKGLVESVVEYLWGTRSKEDLQLQMNEVVEWQQPVEGAALSSFSPVNVMLAIGLLYIAYIIFRKKKDALCEVPSENTEDPDDLKDKKRFLEVYPQVKLDLEQHIRKLHALADKIDKNSFHNMEDIKKNIDAIKLAKANARLTTNAKRLMTTGKVSARNTRQIEKAFGGTALTMTKGARIMGAATAGLFLVLDVVSIVEDSKHLHEGAKAESAADLRQQAQDLEQKLQELIQVHDSLTK